MTKLTRTHTVVNLGISSAAFDEIVALLRDAGYDHVFLEDGSADMSGIAIVRNADDVHAKSAFEWKPMDSAPRDGTVLLLRWGADGVTPGFWVGEFGDKPESCGAFPWAFIDADSTEKNTYILNQAADNEYGPTHWAPYSAEVFDFNVEDAKVGKRWREDSSLETWFPFTAAELAALKEMVKELRAKVIRASYEPLQIERVDWPRRRCVLVFTHDTLGDGMFTPLVEEAAAELAQADPAGTLENYTAKNGIHIEAISADAGSGFGLGLRAPDIDSIALAAAKDIHSFTALNETQLVARIQVRVIEAIKVIKGGRSDG